MCRPAGTQTLDNQMPLIGIHGTAAWSDGQAEAEGLYFVTMQVTAFPVTCQVSCTDPPSQVGMLSAELRKLTL